MTNRDQPAAPVDGAADRVGRDLIPSPPTSLAPLGTGSLPDGTRKGRGETEPVSKRRPSRGRFRPGQSGNPRTAEARPRSPRARGESARRKSRGRGKRPAAAHHQARSRGEAARQSSGERRPARGAVRSRSASGGSGPSAAADRRTSPRGRRPRRRRARPPFFAADAMTRSLGLTAMRRRHTALFLRPAVPDPGSASRSRPLRGSLPPGLSTRGSRTVTPARRSGSLRQTIAASARRGHPKGRSEAEEARSALTATGRRGQPRREIICECRRAKQGR